MLVSSSSASILPSTRPTRASSGQRALSLCNEERYALLLIEGFGQGKQVIKSFKDQQTETINQGNVSRKLPQNMQRNARKKLRQLVAAATLDDRPATGLKH
ncbi:hypothetical protein [Halomonas llamarensis]|uniref:Uncharacterized protein n=1 Tax=Halomonas llamarensis TaxID=2945104 RepID=A0ABT0ST72_9GAMM|nr:hypothetical protein [Halomonas llamarensis]MCL7930922.1 hypothetical protein [Halomonas llamarensis]